VNVLPSPCFLKQFGEVTFINMKKLSFCLSRWVKPNQEGEVTFIFIIHRYLSVGVRPPQEGAVSLDLLFTRV